MDTFPAEEALRDESSRKLWNPIVSSVYDGVYKDKSCSVVTRYSSTSASVMVQLEDY